MSSSYISNHVHIVFSTKNRVPCILQALQPKLCAYMAGIAANTGMHAVSIGGMDDHVHVLVEIPASMSIAKAVQLLKANSSRWINETKKTRFEWLEGYAAFSVSRSQIRRLMDYIRDQPLHHKRRDFAAAELALLLKKHGLEVRD